MEVEIDDRIRQESIQSHNPSFLQLASYLNANGFETGKNSEEVRFVDQRINKNYNINEKEAYKTLEYLEDCRLKGVPLGFSEVQYPKENGRQRTKSGICFDFDIYQNTSKRIVSEETGQEIVLFIIDIMNELFDERIDGMYHVILLRNQLTPAENNMYRDGIHILFPGLEATKEAKRLIMNRLNEDEYYNDVFTDEHFVKPETFLDIKTASNPILMYGCSRLGKVPYNLSMIQKNSKRAPVTIKEIPPDTNMMLELSLLHKGNVIPRKEFELRAEHKIKQIETGNDDLNTYDNNSMSIEELDDPNYVLVSRMISIMSAERATGNDTWEKIIMALARLSCDSSSNYKQLAMAFSNKCPEKACLSIAQARIDSIWSWVKALGDKSKLPGMGSICFAAKNDNPEAYRKLKGSTPSHMLMCMTSKSDGKLTDYDAAKVLFSLFSEKFYYDSVACLWYELISKNSRGVDKCQVYKFRDTASPDILKKYICEKIPKFIDSIIIYYKKLKDTTKDTDQLKWYKSMITKLSSSRDNVKNNAKSEAILKSSKTVFAYPNFRDKLDKTEMILGVGDGILQLGKKCTLVSGKHTYLVRCYTPVPWGPNDPKTEKIAYLMDKWNSTFKEPDMGMFYLFYFAEMLSGRTPDMKIDIWYGPGKNAKSTWMMLQALTMGTFYATKFNSSFLTQSAARAEHHTSHLMGLVNALYAYTSEVEAGASLNMERVKFLTNGEHMKVREVREKEQTIICRARIHMAVNTELRLAGDTTYGSTRRLRVGHLKKKFVRDPNPANPNEVLCDPDFVNSHIKDIEYQQAWLQILIKQFEILENQYGGKLENVYSKTIEDETNIYIRSQDSVATYIMAKIRPSPNGEIKLSDLIGHYVAWYRTNVNTDKNYINNIDYIKSQFTSSSISGSMEKTEEGDWIFKGFTVSTGILQ